MDSLADDISSNKKTLSRSRIVQNQLQNVENANYNLTKRPTQLFLNQVNIFIFYPSLVTILWAVVCMMRLPEAPYNEPDTAWPLI